MREIVLDTETTGMDPVKGDKLVEIGCVELENHLPTGKTYHVYINPEREIPPEATAVHGITDDFVKDKPTFGEIVGDFMDFIGNDRLVIHNAEFDVKFLNAELKTFGFPSLDSRRVFDTLRMAREKFPGSPANLDALCRRFNIDNSGRTYHGALLDSQLLAEVYLELLGGRQRGLGISEASIAVEKTIQASNREFREARVFTPSEEELAAHEEMLGKLKDPLWKSN
ncbi:MAG: DNA polymerase III subunit epsilon [Micavibrio aeruginosavorus]|uniref:DNA polymerase III subunit epsilon n=1 Tax=Micavibrio aeruginosavorus TaxID=349221 RepID=A0A2W5PW92_9BACT|nr:MAG: DNA polymerase III subunit epsilon [Micavibrio aeruginosavorus]